MDRMLDLASRRSNPSLLKAWIKCIVDSRSSKIHLKSPSHLPLTYTGTSVDQATVNKAGRQEISQLHLLKIIHHPATLQPHLLGPPSFTSSIPPPTPQLAIATSPAAPHHLLSHPAQHLLRQLCYLDRQTRQIASPSFFSLPASYSYRAYRHFCFCLLESLNPSSSFCSSTEVKGR
ncbi:hypothetical protein JMJ77_0002770 [Colletotrichum scovillei]|uniref:Uncharacterized protein n=1 Tax=Colletotrichum scovillei TaxID=1209932 RepID=A0A9P7RAB5_9PEZI|nr:hypothetical protein JMJ77_0002770 [Colletotrichum scovillei]KAG7071195.1 hypothetical protein JMJ76_0002432 [Colletotrichum scovillei]KAG7079452.1 hypothetical protein JMJ78_0003105 [Colletotrichum scovillei]